MGLEDKVKFHDFVPYYKRETLYPVTLEAMACGKSVIVDLILDRLEFAGDAGMLVNPCDATQLADAILKILTESRQDCFTGKDD